jgi:hypothetical protein
VDGRAESLTSDPAEVYENFMLRRLTAAVRGGYGVKVPKWLRMETDPTLRRCPACGERFAATRPGEYVEHYLEKHANVPPKAD